MRIACYIACHATFNQMRTVLEPAGFDCWQFPHETALLVALRRQRFDLILVDTEQVDGSMISAWLGCRTGESTPLILLSVDCGAAEVAHALDSGAEDVIRRPVAPVELIARVHSVLRRYRKTDSRQLLELRGFSLDRSSCTLLNHDVRIDLTPREFALAWLFFSSAGNYLSRKTLSAMIWGVDEDISNRSIEQHVHMLRKKLKLGPARGLQLRAAYTKGYRLELVGDFVAPGRPDDRTSQVRHGVFDTQAATHDPLSPHAANANVPLQFSRF
jgi:DNA-binding response OmpR family regulator